MSCRSSRLRRASPGAYLAAGSFPAFYQGYSGHPIEVYTSRGRYVGNAKDPNGFPENIGGDYNLDGVGNDHPNFVGQSINAAYSHANPADGIFTDNNESVAASRARNPPTQSRRAMPPTASTPNTLFVNPPGSNGVALRRTGPQRVPGTLVQRSGRSAAEELQGHGSCEDAAPL